jgi:signal transduction histidine kinase
MHGVQLGVNLIDIVLVTWVTDLAIVYYRQSRQRQEILTRQNIELAASRAEVARQNQFLEEQSQELDRRRAAAQEEADRKGRFLAAASHDIRTPANAISLLAELLQQSAATAESGGDVGELARELQKSATNLVALASDVLDVTRLDTGKVELRVTDFALAELIAEQCRQQKMIAEQKGLSLCCGTTEAGLMIRADRVKLSRVLANLIANGIKFTEKGDVSVRAALRSDGQLAVEVADTGIGIAPEFQEKIFDEYFQLRRPSKERERSAGSGLGLAICRRLIGAMGGRLEVRSEPGNGSTFSVILPATTVLGGGAVGGAAAAEMVVPLAS